MSNEVRVCPICGKETRQPKRHWNQYHSGEGDYVPFPLVEETLPLFACYLVYNLIDHKHSCIFSFAAKPPHEYGQRVIKRFGVDGEFDEMSQLYLCVSDEVEQVNFISPEEKYKFIKQYCERHYQVTEVIPETVAIEGVLRCTKLVSANRRLGKTRRGRVHLTPEYAQELKELEESLSRAQIPSDFLGKDNLYEITLTFMSSQGFLRYDTDNKIKAVIDAISRYLGINDNRIVKIDASKVQIANNYKGRDWVYFKLQKAPLAPKEYQLKYAELLDWAKSEDMI